LNYETRDYKDIIQKLTDNKCFTSFLLVLGLYVLVYLSNCISYKEILINDFAPTLITEKAETFLK